MQYFAAEKYRGQRIRFSALIKAEGVEGWGGIWMRVDDVDKPGTSFDNMQNRPVKGTRGTYQVKMRHGVSRLITGQRHTLGIIFHDAS